MGDGVHATVSVEQPITVQDQSSQTTYHLKNGEKACPCCQLYGVPCRQVCATEDELETLQSGAGQPPLGRPAWDFLHLAPTFSWTLPISSWCQCRLLGFYAEICRPASLT